MIQANPTYDLVRLAFAERFAVLSRHERMAGLLGNREIALLRSLGLANASSVLEIGCGPGFVAGMLADAANPGTVVGIDLAEDPSFQERSGASAPVDWISFARKFVQPLHPNLRLRKGTASETGLPSQAFDFVYSRFLYRHLSDPIEALAEARRVTRPGGRVAALEIEDSWIVIEPSSEAMDLGWARARGLERAVRGDRLVARKLPGLFARTGFRDVEARFVSVTSLDIGFDAFLEVAAHVALSSLDPDETGTLFESIDTSFDRREGSEPFGALGLLLVSGVA